MEDTSQQLPWSGNWKAERVEKVNDYLYKINDLSIENTPGQDFVRLYGKRMLGLYSYFYWHIIHEDIAHYEGVKKIVPDLRLTLIDIFEATNEDGSLTDDARARGPYLEYFLKKYPQDSRINNKTNVWFEEVYYVPTMGEVFPNYSGKPFVDFGIIPMSMPGPEYDRWCSSVWTERSSYGIDGLKVLSEKMKQDKSKKRFPDKVFISRRDVNKRLAEFVDVSGYEYLIQERLFEDNFLEDYFSNLGYGVYALEELSYEEQISMFVHATHVAGTAGAGFANMHLCKEGTKLFELRVLPSYHFNYEYYRDFNNIDYYGIELRDHGVAVPWSKDKMLAKLDELDIF